MENGIDAVDMILEVIEKVFRSDDIAQFALGDIAPLVAIPQPVADNQVGQSPRLQPRNEIGADKPCPACYDNHARVLLLPKYMSLPQAQAGIARNSPAGG